jgi:sorting nexin-5/6/32
MKQELEAEYLATFKKTVAMHEVFLQRLASHPILRLDVNFKVFLEYEPELSVRGKNSKEKLSGFFKSVTQSVDEVLLSNQKDKDDFFEHQRTFLVEYFTRVKDATLRADKMTKSHKNVADSYIKISSCLVQLATADNSELDRLLVKVSESLEKARKLEGRVASDEDLKLSDTLRYYMRDSAAAKNLLYRRLRALANYETATKNLDKARAKNKDVPAAEEQQHQLGEKFDKLSETAKNELVDFKTRRIAHFKKNLVDLAEFELKHAKAQVQLLSNAITALKEL